MRRSIAFIVLTLSLATFPQTSRADESVHMANGIKIGEVSSNSAIVWTRLTKNPERNIKGTPFPKNINKERRSLKFDDLTKMVQRQIDRFLCLWIDDFQEWSEPLRTDDSPHRSPTVVLNGMGRCPTIRGKEKKPMTQTRYDIISALLETGERGLTKDELDKRSGHTDARKTLKLLAVSDPDWGSVILMAGSKGMRYRLHFD